MPSDSVLRRIGLLCGTVIVSSTLAACVSEPSPIPESEPPAPPDTTVYFYPSQGQTAEQQDRDKFECHNWAVQQSNFDPIAPGTPPHLRVRAAAGPPPGTGIAVGAVAGAALGAAVSPPWETGEGAVLGAVAGAVVGGIAESAAAQQARERSAADVHSAQAARLEQQSRNYRRAMSACLEGRGYNVR